MMRPSKEQSSIIPVNRFAGLCLGGGKGQKTCVAIFEYYSKHEKVFLSRIYDKLGPREDRSSDEILYNLLTQEERNIDLLALNVPWTLPKCMRCQLPCPGHDHCEEPEIEWMWERHRKRGEGKRPNKIFTPYTQRCVELFIAEELEEVFHPPDALGANIAPVTARAYYLSRRLKIKMLEVYPQLSLWRIGRKLGLTKNALRYHKHAVDGEENRWHILKKLVDENIAFVYDQDIRILAQDSSAFEAFICGLTAYLYQVGKCEERPQGFPPEETWIAFPRLD